MTAAEDRHVTNEPTPFAMVPEALLYDPDLSDKAVRLYAVLRRHGDDPANCYPSKRRLADLMGCSPASIGRPAKELEDAGWIARVPRTDAFDAPTSNGYYVYAARRLSATPAQESGDPPRVGAEGVRAGERAEGEQVEREPENETTRAGQPALELLGGPVPDAFVEFWKAYPRGDGKPAAKAAWARAREKATPAEIMAGLARWVAYWEARDQPEFVPWAQKWLRMEQWNATPPPVRVANAPAAGPRAPIVTDREMVTGRTPRHLL